MQAAVLIFFFKKKLARHRYLEFDSNNQKTCSLVHRGTRVLSPSPPVSRLILSCGPIFQAILNQEHKINIVDPDQLYSEEAI